MFPLGLLNSESAARKGCKLWTALCTLLCTVSCTLYCTVYCTLHCTLYCTLYCTVYCLFVSFCVKFMWPHFQFIIKCKGLILYLQWDYNSRCNDSEKEKFSIYSLQNRTKLTRCIELLLLTNLSDLLLKH